MAQVPETTHLTPRQSLRHGREERNQCRIKGGKQRERERERKSEIFFVGFRHILRRDERFSEKLLSPNN
jgi:hypothetical protein